MTAGWGIPMTSSTVGATSLRAPSRSRMGWVGRVHHDKGHQVGGVGAVGLAGGGVELFDVAVVGGDCHHIALGQGIAHHLLQGPLTWAQASSLAAVFWCGR
jgi:hypothetical protein